MTKLLPSSVSSVDAHPLVLVVDDEPRIIRFVRINLEMEGFRVIEASDGLAAAEQVREKMPDIVILDVMMPEMDGFETLRMIREISSVPVIMLTVRSSEEDKVRGLDLGADDYITKPFSPRELVSRVRAVLRRFQTAVPGEAAVLEIDEYLAVDFNTAEVIVAGERVKLRPTEFRLLRHLIENAGWTVPHSTLLSKVWGYEYKDEISYLRLYINYLRKKIEPDPANPRYIVTERGMGYRFVNFRSGAT
jgi:DNA-binding response OmpR family regulator